MPYLIDGHNLIGQLSDISLEDPNDEALLVQKLTGFVARVRQKCVVVFDYGIPAGRSRMSRRGIDVRFAPAHSNADQVIKGRIQREHNPSQWTVVSSDNDVLTMARRYRMTAVKAVDFAGQLQRPEPPPRPDVGEAADVKLDEYEVAEWLRLFRGD